MRFIYKKEDFEKLLKEESIIVMDTNVILGLYSFTPETIEDIIDSFENKLNLFWLPNQVYLEYTRLYEKIRKREANRFQNLKEEMCKAISDVIGTVSQKYGSYNKYKLPEVDDSKNKLVESINNAVNIAKKDLEKLQIEHSKKISCISEENDIVHKFVTKMKQSSCTDGFSMLELIDIYEEGEKRFKYKMPPGVTDISKPNNGEEYSDFVLKKYGDLIIWKEMLRKVKGKDVTLIFIENELKEDWWSYSKNRPKRIPLIMEQEFNKESGVNSKFYMVSFDELISHWGNILNIQPNSILEITKRMDFVRKIEAYLISNQANILIKYIEEDTEKIKKYICNNLLNKSVGSDNIEEIEDVEIFNIKVIHSSFYYDQSECQIELISKIMGILNANVSVYFTEEANLSTRIIAKFELETNLYLKIDNEKEPKNAIECDMIEFNGFKIKDIDYNEEEVYNNFHDEDEESDALHIVSFCPDCGFELTGGSGFCIRCTSGH